MNEVLAQPFWGNTVYDYLFVLGAIIFGVLIIKIIKGPVLRNVKALTSKTKSVVDDFIVDSVERFGIPALYIVVISWALRLLNMSPRMISFIEFATTIIVTVLVIRFISSTILMLLTRYVRHQSGGEEKVKQLYGIMVIINVFIWTVGILFLLDNWGKDVTAIIASLGIGGIAIALAAQNIVGDIFNYFVIFFDKPFEVGDFVVIDDKNGVIEYVGLKTTRIKTLSGEQLVFSNSDLTNSRIHNFKKMERRRIVFKVKTSFETTHQQLAEIPAIIKGIVLEQKPVTFDRAHFFAYTDSGWDFEIVYYVESGDYNLYMDIQQAINLRIHEEFERKGIAVAMPARALYINRDEEDESDRNDPPSLLVQGETPPGA
ncbi:MAG TPA: mechanosensitive ion channel family protein [Cyclobacteriaceae bacterium]|nr:mechanosensitive ion channel family protein [Cyclobacteriaceae bacterium]